LQVASALVHYAAAMKNAVPHLTKIAEYGGLDVICANA